MNSENLLGARNTAQNVISTTIAHWNLLLDTACTVLQCSQPTEAEEPPPRRGSSLYTAGALKTPIYRLDESDLAVIEKYAKVYATRFRFQAEVDDIYQDLVHEILRTNYLSRFDSTKNSLAGYISGFVYNYFCKRYKVKGYAVNLPAPLSDTKREQAVERITWAQTKNVDVASIETLETLAIRLDEDVPPSSGVEYTFTGARIRVVHFGDSAGSESTIIWRSSSNILRLLALGFFQEEIATVLEVSKGWISKKVKRIRDTPSLQDWFDTLTS